MEPKRDRDVVLEIEGGRIHFRVYGVRSPRNMPYDDCSGVALRLTPAVGALGMTLRYRVDLLGRDGEPAIAIGDTAGLPEARDLWRRAAGEIGKPAVMLMPDGADANQPPSDPPPPGIVRSVEGGRVRVTVNRSRLEYVFVFLLAIGLSVTMANSEPSQDSAFFMLVAGGLLVYAVVGGLSSRFVEIADGTLAAGLRTPLGALARVEMPLSDIDVVLWGRTVKGWGKTRAAFAIATAQRARSFDRLPEDQAKWLAQFVRQAVRS